MPKIFPALKTFVDSVEPYFKILAVPIFAVFFYAGTSWLNSNYVNKTEFKAAIVELKADREKGEQEQKAVLNKISDKLDTLIVRDSATVQRLGDFERRIERLEDKVDGLNK